MRGQRRRLTVGVTLVAAILGSACAAETRDEGFMPVATGAEGGKNDDPQGDTEGVLDLGGGGLIPPAQCPAIGTESGSEGGIADFDFSYVWIANSQNGTVSKIDTKTGEEAARYITSPAGLNGDPSRTAVNLVGDVAVTSRAGTVTKIAASGERCEDLDGNGRIDSSSGPDDVYPWGEDECVRWHAELPGGGGAPLNHQGARPTAWDGGTPDDPCSRLWVGWFHKGQNIGYFRRLSGADGSVLDEVEVPDWDTSFTGKNWGPYGGAVDKDGDFWVLGWGGPLVRIDGDTLEVARWEAPEGTHPYGLTLDANGHPWTAGKNGDVLHFDPDTEQFDRIDIAGTVGGRPLRGLQIDRNGQAFIAANFPCGVVQIDTESRTVVNDAIELPNCDTPVGVGIDIDGFVWIPDQGANVAYRLDPTTLVSTVTEGLARPYTYSDMTGAGLDLQFYPPAG